MTITFDPETEALLQERANAEGLTVAAYVKRLLDAEQAAEDEIKTLALEGLSSGHPFEIGPGYWEDKHRHLDEVLSKSGRR